MLNRKSPDYLEGTAGRNTVIRGNSGEGLQSYEESSVILRNTKTHIMNRNRNVKGPSGVAF